MKKDLITPGKIQTFLGAETQTAQILQQLFVKNKPYSDELKRLLVINTPDCMDKSIQSYSDIVAKADLKFLKDNHYIRLTPKLYMPEHAEVKSYLVISHDSFFPNAANNYFRDSNIIIDIICHTDQWEIGNFQIRPLKIAGIITGILDKRRLNSIGELNFGGCTEMVFDDVLSGYNLLFNVVRFSEDEQHEVRQNG